MKKIPVHKAADKIPGGIVLRRVPEDRSDPVDYMHSDDYYMFCLIETGEVSMIVDFEQYDLSAPAVFCILPEQVHFAINYRNIRGWVVSIDSMLVKNEYKEIFFKNAICQNAIHLTADTVNDLKSCLLLLQKRLNSNIQPLEQDVVRSLISVYTGMIAEICQTGFPISANRRPAIITFQFKSLLSANYKTVKNPAQYASMLNLSPVYLNESVKKTTGLTVSDCILNEIITHAKRLLFHTDLNVKEIARELGYDDYAYFTRLFTKALSLSPTRFRKRYLK